mmetsp:Transcript_11603/g.18616  ORF Transcript_11603/g.18616 Transcript_11603/m.18616 type:complete len:92 (+) Transcript_11603:411-686(+)
MRSLVEEYFESYKEAQHGSKSQMAIKVVSVIKESGGRFLKPGPDGWWIEAEDKLAEEKVSHAFRTLKLETKTVKVPSEKDAEASTKKPRTG